MIVGGTTCYVDGERKIVMVHAPEAPIAQDHKEHLKIAQRLRAYITVKRRHFAIDSIEYRKAFEFIDKFERGELQTLRTP
jgi:hypothetical protein